MQSPTSYSGLGAPIGAKYFVYILQCSDDTLYTGITGNIERRLSQHQNGDVSYTKSRLPVTLVVFHVFYDKHKAVQFEKYLKSGSGRAFVKRHLI